MKTITASERLQFLAGRLAGLSASLKHELSDTTRAELLELATLAESIQLPEVIQ